ncbi:MAG: DapH/DapD/GlmU-related protein [Candidatus Aenigmatarchaeota archaeon]
MTGITKLGSNINIHKTAKIVGNVVIFDNVEIGENCIIEPNAIIGHPLTSYYNDGDYKNPKTVIMDGCIVRSGTTLYCGVELGRNVKTGTNAIVRENCKFGENTIIGTAVQVENDTVVGKDTMLETGCHITAFAEIGNDVFVGPHVVTTNDNKMLRPIDRKMGKSVVLKGPTLEDGVRVGANAVILPGVRIGKNSVIGANAVVTSDVAPNSVMLGIPAKFVKEVGEEYRI